MSSVLLIPAYRPGPALPGLVRAVSGPDFRGIVVIDDGSGPAYSAVFAECRACEGITVLAHERNRGKGAALKTGLEHAAARFPGCGVVTADADGQHLPEDILRVARRLSGSNAERLVLGARRFDAGVPVRSRIGNRLSALFVHLLLGARITDTQTGLRGIPPGFCAVLSTIRSDGYEFELDMLNAAAHLSIPIDEEPIQTVYEPGNPTSHFRPFRDSLRIGFVLARFSLLSLATAGVDNAVFLAASSAGLGIAPAQVAARAASVAFNYPLARSAVFQSGRLHSTTLPRYLALVAGSGLASYHLLTCLHARLGWSVIAAKLTAESALFLANFLVQRDLVFGRRGRRR